MPSVAATATNSAESPQQSDRAAVVANVAKDVTNIVRARTQGTLSLLEQSEVTCALHGGSGLGPFTTRAASAEMLPRVRPPVELADVPPGRGCLTVQ